MHTFQAPCLAWLRAGQWVQRCCGIKTNWHRERWLIRDAAGNAASPSDVLRALQRCEKLEEQQSSSDWEGIRRANFVVQRSTPAFFSCFFFTYYRQWLDVIEIGFEKGSDDGDPLVASAYSWSASVVPASSLLAPLTAILFAWIPFSDIGQNKAHLRTLRQLLLEDGLEVELERSRGLRD